MARKPRVTAEEFAIKHAARTKAAQGDARKGIERVTKSPAESAVEQIDVMKRNLMASLEDGTWERNMLKVTLSDWKKKMIDKGLPRVAAGLDAAMPKTIESAKALLADVETVMNEIDTMPKGDIESNINRMIHNARRMSELKKARG